MAVGLRKSSLEDRHFWAEKMVASCGQSRSRAAAVALLCRLREKKNF